MEEIPCKPANFTTQANALIRKNLVIQKRNFRGTGTLLMYPILVCLLLFGLQRFTVETVHGTFLKQLLLSCSYGMMHQMKSLTEMCGVTVECAHPSPTRLPALFQIPSPELRATRGYNKSNLGYYASLPHNNCRQMGWCPVTILFTGANRSLAHSLAENLFGSETLNEPPDSMDVLTIASKFILGTALAPHATYFEDPSLSSPPHFGPPLNENPEDPSKSIVIDLPLNIIQRRCKEGFRFNISIDVDGDTVTKDVECVRGLYLWRDNSLDIIHELYRGYIPEGSPLQMANEFLGAYDFMDTNESIFNVIVWYNETYKPPPIELVKGRTRASALRIFRALNVASNSYLQFFRSSGVRMLLEFVKEMPIRESFISYANLATIAGPLVFASTIQSLILTMLQSIVYEKQRKLRMIMKMHGLGDRSYWIINYVYFLLISSAYILSMVVCGSILGLRIFTFNDYSVLFVFFSLYINLQIAFAFLMSTLFSEVKTARVSGQIYIYAMLFAQMLLLDQLYSKKTSSSELLQALYAIPSIALYRGLRELAQYSQEAEYLASTQAVWKDIMSYKEGMFSILVIMMVEWPIFLLIAYYLDQVGSNGSGVRKHPLWFFPCLQGKAKKYDQRKGTDVLVGMEKSDISQEREKVIRLVEESYQGHLIICDDLKKIYPPRDGNPAKHAVRSLSLALPQGECFGMLGPNGAGKTSFISMMTGLVTPTSGTAFVQGLDIRHDMDKVYTRMGVCPQHDLIWDILTGREHLLFYGRLKNLEGVVLSQAVEESLRSVNLLDKAHKRAGQYSGGMKRRLSVAISLIGNPKVVYLDEPSTGLDPASRKSLWNVVQDAKKDKAIILTTHSMEEAEFLCDRVGIFVDGSLQCIGNPKELRARYGGYFLLTITAPTNQGDDVEKLVLLLSPGVKKVYHISGTQKFHLPKKEVRLADVFREVENAKKRIDIQDWGLADATLEDVFITVAKDAQSIS